MHGDNGLARYMRGQPLMCSVLVMAGRVVLAATPQSQWFVGHAIMYCLIAGAVRMHAWNKLIPCHHILLNDLRFSGAARTQIQNLVPWSSILGEFRLSMHLALVFGVETLLVTIMNHLLDPVWDHEQAEVGLLAMLGLEAVMNLCVGPGGSRLHSRWLMLVCGTATQCDVRAYRRTCTGCTSAGRRNSPQRIRRLPRSGMSPSATIAVPCSWPRQ